MNKIKRKSTKLDIYVQITIQDRDYTPKTLGHN